MPGLRGGLDQRRRQPEIMDEPHLERTRHFHALRGLERINRVSGSSRILWRAIRSLSHSSGRPLRLLDIACGAGDVPFALWRRARRAGIELQITGCDISSQALDYARTRVERAGAEISFLLLDVLADELPAGYDVVTSSLFVHHLDNEQAQHLLRRMAAAAARMVLVNDLRRSWTGYMLALIGTRLLSRSDIVRIDGPRSVQAAFTLQEMKQLAENAGLTGATVEPRWPCRMLLTWTRHEA